jgi:hypothetical protein
MSSDQPVQFSFDTGAEHDAQVKLEPVRIRVLDRFAEPLANASCNVDTPILGTRTKTLDGKGWLDIKCPKGTAYVDLEIVDADEEDQRRVWLGPLEGDDGDETQRRLMNLGYVADDAEGGDDTSQDDRSAAASGGDGDDAGDDGSSDPWTEARRGFLREYGVDTEDPDFTSQLGRLEDSLKSQDKPQEVDKNVLQDQSGDASDPGERT